MITKIIDEHKIQQAKRLIEKYDKVVILTHTSPDGDAIGSSLGMYHFLLEQDKDVQVIVPDEIASNLLWMKGAHDILVFDKNESLAQECIDASELIICLDFNGPARLGKMQHLLQTAKSKILLIDHHENPEMEADALISYPKMSSTGEMVFRVICRMGYFEDINRDSAEAIYTAMMTDTGNFSYNSNSPEIYYIIAELLKKGVNKEQVYRNIFHNQSESRLRLNSYAIANNMELFPELRAAVITLTLEEMQQHNYQKGDVDGLVNVPLTIKGIDCVALFKEDVGKVKISLRSKGDIAVNQLANQYFSGGGHKNAAGGAWFASIKEGVELFHKVLPDFLGGK
ncbi:MAG: DHH family phosphoesterase [Bacteroidales bacterium]